MEKLMICPKAKGCKDKDDCRGHYKPHSKVTTCLSHWEPGCPSCIPYKPNPRLSSRQAAKAFISKKYEKNSCANMCGIAMELFQAGVRWSRNNRA